jgi:hypothetical protein
MTDQKINTKINWYAQRAQKNRLWSLIKTICELIGEDEEFIREYAKEVYNANLEDVDGAIECFKDLLEQLKNNEPN